MDLIARAARGWCFQVHRLGGCRMIRYTPLGVFHGKRTLGPFFVVEFSPELVPKRRDRFRRWRLAPRVSHKRYVCVLDEPQNQADANKGEYERFR
jgi:hypothetical protein